MQDQIQTTFDTTTSSSHDDFLEQMLSTLPSFCWDLKPEDENTNPTNINNTAPFQFDESAMLVSKLRQHQITNSGGGGGGGGGGISPADKIMMIQQQMQQILPLLGGGAQNDVVVDTGMEGLYNGFGGSLHGSGQTANQFNHSPGGGGAQMQAQNFGAPVSGMVNQTPATISGVGAPAQPRQRVRARRGQATDPHSIAERLRRERIAERMKALQELVPNANKTDKASMLDEIIDYVKFLQLQVKVLSMSRLGGASAVAPLVADRSSEANGGSGRSSNGTQTVSESNVTVTEHQVAKLMEEDMGSAMQYLQGKGLCLMPISLATAISTATCHSRNPLSAPAATNHNSNAIPGAANGEGPTSPSVSVLTVQSAVTLGNGTIDGSLKDAASVSKP